MILLDNLHEFQTAAELSKEIGVSITTIGVALMRMNLGIYSNFIGKFKRV